MKTIVTDMITSQSDIYAEAKKCGAKWVVVYCDHYRGNSKGYFQSVEEFGASESFYWSAKPYDRGAMSVIITDEDVPGIVEKRKALISQIYRIDFNKTEALRKIPQPVRIDGRLGKSNPKRIESEKRNGELCAIREEVCRASDAQKKAVLSELESMEYYSSKLWRMA